VGGFSVSRPPEGASVGDMMSFRREVKFAVRNADLRGVRSILDVNCRRVTHDRPTSRVSSVYFDDDALSGCHENLDGTPRRTKIRIRWYDDGDDRGAVFFEVKRRAGSLVGKLRVPIRCRAPLASMSFGEIHAELRRVLPAPLASLIDGRRQAIHICQYRRTYYEAIDSRVRVTLDGELAYYSQLGSLRPRKRFGVRVPELVIVEGKTGIGESSALRALLEPMQPHVTKSSKYVTGCRTLGLLAGRAGPVALGFE